eukprot:UN08585
MPCKQCRVDALVSYIASAVGVKSTQTVFVYYLLLSDKTNGMSNCIYRVIVRTLGRRKVSGKKYGCGEWWNFKFEENL